MLRPPPLRLGDPVSIVAPASPPRSLDRYRTGLDRLRSLYDVRSAWAPGSEDGYLAGPDHVRATALNQAVHDSAIRAIFCVRGGYGSLRLLSRLDWSRARKNPTLLIGYSDITALHLAYYSRVGWTGISGPVVTEWADIDEKTIAPFRTLAEGGVERIGDSLQPIRSGTKSGPLLGGNLSVLSRLVGTPYAPEWSGAVLVIEDVAEAPYRIDRMLAHLQHAGVLDAVAGVVLGDLSSGDGTSTPTLSMSRVIEDYFQNRPYPVAKGLQYGHLLPRCSLPIGVPVRLSVSSDSAELHPLSPTVKP